MTHEPSSLGVGAAVEADLKVSRRALRRIAAQFVVQIGLNEATQFTVRQNGHRGGNPVRRASIPWNAAPGNRVPFMWSRLN